MTKARAELSRTNGPAAPCLEPGTWDGILGIPVGLGRPTPPGLLPGGHAPLLGWLHLVLEVFFHRHPTFLASPIPCSFYCNVDFTFIYGLFGESGSATHCLATGFFWRIWHRPPRCCDSCISVPGKPALLGWCQVTHAAWGVPWLRWTAAAAALNARLTEIILLGGLISASCLRGSNFSGTLFLSERISRLHTFYTLEPTTTRVLSSEHLPYCLSAIRGFSFIVPISFGSYFKGIEYITAGKAWQLGLWPQFLEELFISQWIMKWRELLVQSGARW